MLGSTSIVLLWLLIINLGIAFGAGVYEHRILVSRWIGTVDSTMHWNPQAARADDTGRRFWVFVTTIPLTLLTLANLWVARDAAGPVRVWWYTAALAALADRLVTFAYFIPTMVGLMNAGDSHEAAIVANRWSHLNYVRHIIVLAAWLAALKTFALFYQRPV